VLVGFTIERYKGIEPAYLLHFVRRLGVEFAEVTPTIFENLPAVLRALGKMKLGFHLPIISEEGYDFSCIEQETKIQKLIDAINANWQKLHIQYCVAHPPEAHLIETPGEVSQEFLFHNLQQLAPPVLIENVPERNGFYFSPFYRKARATLGEKLFGFCYDGPHAFISRKDWLTLLHNFSPELRCVHISDCSREKDLHLPLGQGVLPLDELFAVLKSIGFDGVINLELMPQSLRDIDPILNSYLLVLKIFKPAKYLLAKLKILTVLPFIKHLIIS